MRDSLWRALCAECLLPLCFFFWLAGRKIYKLKIEETSNRHSEDKDIFPSLNHNTYNLIFISVLLGLGYIETCGTISCHLKQVSCIDPIGTLSFIFFPFSQWGAWNLFQMTSDGATRFNATDPLLLLSTTIRKQLQLYLFSHLKSVFKVFSQNPLKQILSMVKAFMKRWTLQAILIRNAQTLKHILFVANNLIDAKKQSVLQKSWID